MENASKALIIAGAILISILIIAIGMYIYTSSTGSINEAISQMDTQEVQAFNSQWTNYEGVQTGSQVKSMLTQMIGQANTYQDEPAKVVAIDASQLDAAYKSVYQEDLKVNAIGITSGTIQEYITVLNNVYSNIKPKKKYKVSFDFDGTSIIRLIKIEDAN